MLNKIYCFNFFKKNKTIESDVEQEKLLHPNHMFDLEHQDNEEQKVALKPPPLFLVVHH
jgi:hypothetical protein